MSIIVQQKNGEEQNFIESFASLDWLDGLISFAFRLLAKLAEPFLAAGLIMSAIDYMSHGTFLVGTARALWVITQGFALESSGGVVLSLSFEAKAEGDTAKMWVQRVLALSLLVVGGVLFFVEMAASVKGFSESTMPDMYIYGMAVLRSVVSLGYIAVMRTKHHRFSGEEPTAQPAPAQPDIRNIVDDLAAQMRNQLRNELSGLRTEFAQLRSAHQEVQGQLEAAQRTLVTEVCTEQTMVRSARRLRKVDTNPELCAVGAAQSEDAEARVHRFIQEFQAAQGRIPTLGEIVDADVCAKNTASRYRKTLLSAQSVQ